MTAAAAAGPAMYEGFVASRLIVSLQRFERQIGVMFGAVAQRRLALQHRLIALDAVAAAADASDGDHPSWTSGSPAASATAPPVAAWSFSTRAQHPNPTGDERSPFGTEQPRASQRRRY